MKSEIKFNIKEMFPELFDNETTVEQIDDCNQNPFPYESLLYVNNDINCLLRLYRIVCNSVHQKVLIGKSVKSNKVIICLKK